MHPLKFMSLQWIQMVLHPHPLGSSHGAPSTCLCCTVASLQLQFSEDSSLVTGAPLAVPAWSWKSLYPPQGSLWLMADWCGRVKAHLLSPRQDKLSAQLPIDYTRAVTWTKTAPLLSFFPLTCLVSLTPLLASFVSSALTNLLPTDSHIKVIP